MFKYYANFFKYYYSNSSGHSGSSQMSHTVYGVAVDAVAAPLNKFAKNSSIVLPPLLLYLFKSISIYLNHYLFL